MALGRIDEVGEEEEDVARSHVIDMKLTKETTRHPTRTSNQLNDTSNPLDELESLSFSMTAVSPPRNKRGGTVYSVPSNELSLNDSVDSLHVRCSKERGTGVLVERLRHA